MNPNLLLQPERIKVLESIKSRENIRRKEESFADFEIFNDNIYPFVYDEIKKQTSKETADSMPIVASINIGKRIVKSEATIYNTDPVRTFDSNKSNDIALNAIYSDGAFNSKLQKENEYFKYRNQGFLQVVPKDKKLTLRVLLSHHIDVIPQFNNPEKAYAYIISAFDKSSVLQSDQVNLTIADADDYKASLERYVVWTEEYNFIMNGKGETVGEVLPNPIKKLPFVDVSKEKDFEFFVRTGMNLSEFTVLYNTIWSDDLYITRMQGFSQAVFFGNVDMMPREYKIGTGRAIVLPSDPKNPDNKLDFKFVTPTPDLAGARESRQALLANFLTSRGISPKTISAALDSNESYTSGFERLLAMIDKFEATKEDFDLFKWVEFELADIVKKYAYYFSNDSELLDPKYWVTQSVLASEFSVKFHEPEMVQTLAEKIENLKSKIDLGISDKVLALMELENLTEEQAEEKISKITERNKKYSDINTVLTNSNFIKQDGSQAN
jgi:hypothetical protein